MIDSARPIETAEDVLEKTINFISDYQCTLLESCVVAVTDPKGLITYVNEKFCKISNFSKYELIGQDYQHHISRLPNSEFDSGELVLFGNGKVWRSKLYIIQKDGFHYLTGAIIIAFFDSKGNPIQYVVIATDITRRALEFIATTQELSFQNEEKEKRAAELVIANEELAFQNEEKEKRAAELVIANKELAFQNEEKEKRSAELITANQELLFQNQEKENRAAELVIANKELAFQNEEKEKRAWELLVANEELVFQNAEKEKRAQELDIANKELKKAEENIRRLNEEDIHKLNIELERKVIERTEQLEFANKELESFSYSVSHDLRAPLRAVNGYAKIIEEDYQLLFDDEGKRLLSIVQENAKKMGMLIDDLLAFSRLGKKDINKSMVNMTELAESAIRELGQLSPIRAEVIMENLPAAFADSSMMSQVWINILSNAIKYSSNTVMPVVKIGSEEIDGEVIYFVSDNGVGFDMQYSHKLFGVFQRLHSSGDFEGTGVGLALVHRIITKQEGTVWAKAETGKGATFFFSLPARDRHK